MSSNQITSNVFHHIAKLSRLVLVPEDEVIASQLSQAADYVEILKELDTTTISPTYQVNHKKNVMRPDVITNSLPQDVALSQAAKSADGYLLPLPP